MSTPGVPASIGLFMTAMALKSKGHFARAAEKFGGAAAAAQELAAENCLVVAFLRAAQAESLICHSRAPTLTVAETDEARETVVSVLLPQLMSTLKRRNAAGTLLPGSCRAAEVDWWRVTMERTLLEQGMSVKAARAGGETYGARLGSDAYMYAACIAFDVLLFAARINMPREMQLSNAAFVISALKIMAESNEIPAVIVDGVNEFVVTSASEQLLAQKARRTLLDARRASIMDREVFELMAEEWQLVERSGAVAMRMLGADLVSTASISESLDAAAAEAAVRGLRECALAGCNSKEVHVSQFKRCGACRTVAYCCREHQVEDWPAHKAACKAARKATGAASSSK